MCQVQVCIGVVLLLLGAGLLEVSDSQQRTALERLRIGCRLGFRRRTASKGRLVLGFLKLNGLKFHPSKAI